jgi:hypothetical protein
MKPSISKLFSLTTFALVVSLFWQPCEASQSRADVRSELRELEKAGYQPSRGEDNEYPGDVQQAEARVQRHRSDAK